MKEGEGFVSVKGGRVFYRVVGAEKEKTPLLVVHGGPGAPHDYLEPIAALADERPVIFYDQLGCGRSDANEDKSLWTVEHFVNELAQVRKSLALDRFFLLGQSWGSMLAVEYWLREKPGSVAGMVLSGPCLSAERFAIDQRAHIGAFPMEVRHAIEEGEASGDYASEAYQDAMMLFYHRHVCRLDPWPGCLMRTFDTINLDLYRHMWGPSEFTLTGTLKAFDVTPRLHEIRVPTLFTCGQHDEATPETTADYHRLVPGSEMAFFAGASHEHHLEQPTEYVRVVREFLSRAESPASKAQPA